MLNLPGYLSHFPPFAEVYQLSIAEKIRIALLDVQYICQIHSKKWHARRINRTQLLLIFPVMILVEIAALAYRGLVTLWEGCICELESIDSGRAASRHDGQHSIEIVELLQDHHNFDGAREDCNPLFEVLSLDNRLFDPARELQLT